VTDQISISGSLTGIWLRSLAVFLSVGTVIAALEVWALPSRGFSPLWLDISVGVVYGAMLLAIWLITRQVASYLRLDDRGIVIGRRRFAASGRREIELRWDDLKSLAASRFAVRLGIVGLMSRDVWNWVVLTYPQARAVLSHRACPIRNVPPWLATRIGLSPFE